LENIADFRSGKSKVVPWLSPPPIAKRSSTLTTSILGWETKALDTETTNPAVSADEFQALEHKVLRAVEIVRREREARASAETEIAALREQLEHATAASNAAYAQIATLHQERELVRTRVEKMLQQMDELV
jgi:chromosome segregation ATPase